MNDQILTGEWHGHYVQHDSRHRIAATFTQDGDRITGQMTDLDTLNERSLYDAVAGAGLPPGADEQIAEHIRREISSMGDEPITARSRLPEKSTLEGSVNGDLVRFTKSYQGDFVVGFVVGDEELTQTKPGHAVEYSGRLSQDGNLIAGRWTIYESTGTRGYIDGAFELRRIVP